MPRIIQVLVSPDGQSTIQTRGYQGTDCLQASKFLEQALGAVRAEQKTGEYFQVANERPNEIRQ